MTLFIHFHLLLNTHIPSSTTFQKFMSTITHFSALPTSMGNAVAHLLWYQPQLAMDWPPVPLFLPRLTILWCTTLQNYRLTVAPSLILWLLTPPLMPFTSTTNRSLSSTQALYSKPCIRSTIHRLLFLINPVTCAKHSNPLTNCQHTQVRATW